jgi:nucleoside-diphosphate-sugar epimerase
MIDLTLAGDPFPLYGDGSVSRSFTYVGDVVEANLAALFHPAPPGTVVNIANESTASMRELIELVGDAVGTPVQIDSHPAAAGDAQRTGGSSQLAREVLDWSPTTPLPDGIAAMVAWCRG